MRIQITVTKIITIYCFFYAIAKLFAIFKGAWLLPNAVIIAGLLGLGAIGVYVIKRNSYNWLFIIIGVVLVSALRYYETEWVVYLQELFT